MDNESPLEMKDREFNSSFNELESFRVNQRVFRSFDRIVKNLQKLGNVNKVEKQKLPVSSAYKDGSLLQLSKRKNTQFSTVKDALKILFTNQN